MTAERVRDGLCTDRLARPGRAGEVESEREARGMALAETPAIEDQVMARDVDQRLVKRLPRCRGHNHVLQRATGNDGFDRSPSASQAAKYAEEWVGHSRTAGCNRCASQRQHAHALDPAEARHASGCGTLVEHVDDRSS